MFAAYFDETGVHHDAKNILVVGYIGTTATWDRLDEQWKQALQRWNMGTFHMKEEEAPKSRLDGWEYGREQKVREFGQIVRESDLSAIMASVSHIDFRSILAPVAKRKWSMLTASRRQPTKFMNPYPLLCYLSIDAIHMWSLEMTVDPGQVQTVFARPAEGRHDADVLANHLCQRYGMPSPQWAEMRDNCRLQAADAAAWSYACSQDDGRPFFERHTAFIEKSLFWKRFPSGSLRGLANIIENDLSREDA